MKFKFEELEVWQQGINLAEKVYKQTRSFPQEETYGIISQLRRASLSIALNVAEGSGRSSDKEFKQFLFVARGSLYETITLIQMSLKLKYLTLEQYEELLADCEKVMSKLSGLINYLKGNR